MGTRKNAIHMTTAERDNFLRAVLTLKNTIANPADPAAQQISIYDQFTAIHFYVFSINVPGGGTVNMGHQGPAFGPWHRYYLLLFEQALQNVDPSVTLPYWDWTDHVGTQNILFQPNFLGPNGGAGGVGGGTVESGYFAFTAPGSPGNPTPLPPWWPAGLLGWRIRPSLSEVFGTALRRNLGSFANLANQSDIVAALDRPNYENPNGVRPALEAALRLHNNTHNWVGGHMGGAASPNDLIFWLHHCNVDRLWAMWQIDGHEGAAFYPAGGWPNGHNLSDPMWPWVGGLAGYSVNGAQPDIVLANFTAAPIQHPSDMLNHRALGYVYDTEPIVGVALDQTGSMLGMTPDPMTGAPPNVSKWEAARQGVSFFLHDCEAAYTAKEAYVTAGVQTFRTLAGVNTFTKIFAPGSAFNVIKNGGTHSQAVFDANIAAQSPNGGTPIAGALTDTNTSLVRAPFADQPAGEQRYLAILTDGKETAAPLLNTLAEPEFPNTVIFGMGFGVGGGWDGVDYATIQDITEKGRLAPSGTAQIFHGENAAVIDKFFTNSVASSIGYTPTSDPTFELFPGEFLHFPFDATDADQSFMLTALGFDLSDDNWDFCLMAPDGTHCVDTRPHAEPAQGHTLHDHAGNRDHLVSATTAYLITLKKNRGRCTIFLHRNGADTSIWVGRWYLMAFYKAREDAPVMIMPSISDFLLPVGAPPVRGPLYTRFDQPAAQRLALRVIPNKPKHRFAVGMPGLSNLKEGNPCSLSVNVFSKTTLRPELTAQVKTPYAGQDFNITLDPHSLPFGQVGQLVMAARLVAPQHSIGNAFADRQTIPIQERNKYVDRDNPRSPFDEVRYLADYEHKKPGLFSIRDEEVILRQQRRTGVFRATVSKNIYPGIYRVAVYVEGTLDPGENVHDEHCCKKEPQRFSRVLHVDVALGILPDAGESRPTLHWIARNKFVVTLTPTDKLGNIAAPANAAAPVVKVNGKVVAGNHVNPYTGEQQVEITLAGKDFHPAPNGQTIAGNAAILNTVSGDQLTLAPGKRLKVEVTVGSVTMPVALPKIVGDRKMKEAFGAGTLEAIQIDMEDREVFQKSEDAKKAGYKVQGSEAKGRDR